MNRDTSSEGGFDKEVPDDLEKLAEEVLDGMFVTFEEHTANRD